MQIKPISEKAYNQAMLTFTAARQETILYREALEQLQQRLQEAKIEIKSLTDELERVKSGSTAQLLAE